MTAGKDRHNMGTPVWIGYATRSAILLMSARPVEKMEVRCPSFPPVWHSVFMERSTMGKATRNSNGSDDTGVHHASTSDQPQGPFSMVCGTARRDGQSWSSQRTACSIPHVRRMHGRFDSFLLHQGFTVQQAPYGLGAAPARPGNEKPSVDNGL